MVGLDLITIAYHAADLGLPLPCVAFTNLYHRDGGLDIMYCYNELGTVIDCGQHPT